MSKTLFITGASSGIGAATARAAAEAGWRVALAARSADRLDALAGDIGGDALALPCDATDAEALKSAMARAAEKFGGLDAVFANAGMGASAAGAENGDLANWRAMIDVNVWGLVATVHAALPHLRKTKGHMLLTGSRAGRATLKGSVYGATKHFVHGFGENLAEEMREWGGRCTVIAPGMVDTPFFDEAKPQALKAEDVARAALYALEQPAHVTVGELYLMPNPEA